MNIKHIGLSWKAHKSLTSLPYAQASFYEPVHGCSLRIYSASTVSTSSSIFSIGPISFIGIRLGYLT